LVSFIHSPQTMHLLKLTSAVTFVLWLGLSTNKAYSNTQHTQLIGQQAAQATQFTVIGIKDKRDPRHNFEIGLVSLALKKTEEEYGPFEIVKAPEMTHSRSIERVKNDFYPNFIRSFGYDANLITDKNMAFIPYPIFRGLLSYRTCFLAQKIARKFHNAQTLEEVQAFTHGQGTGWADTLILNKNGFRVFEISDYSSLIKMTAANRFDLYCRGASELEEEYQRFKNTEGLSYDRSKAFYYPFPHFLFTNKKNTAAIERIQLGLDRALKDGSFEALWQQYHKSSIAFVGMENRQVFVLDNPLIDTLDPSLLDHFYMPLRHLSAPDK